jgi:outer membrane immunogenic protein
MLAYRNVLESFRRGLQPQNSVKRYHLLIKFIIDHQFLITYINKGNKMKIKLLVAAAATVMASSAMAQSKSFEGAYGQLGIGYESVTPSLSLGNLNVANSAGVQVASYPYGSSISNSNSFSGAVGIGYYHTVNKDFLLGIGAEYNPINSQSANYSIYNPTFGTDSGTWKKQNSYNIFISPATPIGSDGLLYGKIGFTGASFKNTLGGESTTTNLTGYSLGAGYKQFITGGLYGFGEVNYASYGNKSQNTSDNVVTNGSTYGLSQSSTFSANAFNVMVGVGYRF